MYVSKGWGGGLQCCQSLISSFSSSKSRKLWANITFVCIYLLIHAHTQCACVCNAPREECFKIHHGLHCYSTYSLDGQEFLLVSLRTATYIVLLLLQQSRRMVRCNHNIICCQILCYLST